MADRSKMTPGSRESLNIASRVFLTIMKKYVFHVNKAIENVRYTCEPPLWEQRDPGICPIWPRGGAEARLRRFSLHPRGR